jgi:hypothetical protein
MKFIFNKIYTELFCFEQTSRNGLVGSGKQTHDDLLRMRKGKRAKFLMMTFDFFLLFIYLMIQCISGKQIGDILF